MKILIWGTGRAVAHVLKYRVKLDDVEAFIDNDSSKKEFMNRPIITPDQINVREYDIIIVANRFASEIYSQCKELGINLDKVIFLYNNYCICDLNRNYDIAEAVFDERYIQTLKHSFHVISTPEIDVINNVDYNKYMSDSVYENDYVRLKNFELVAAEIIKNDIEGCVAELGVFRGEFAKHINRVFPDRKCYLFDTFEGFDVKEAVNELQQDNCNEAFVEVFKNTTMEIVLNNLPNQKQVIFRKGFFPESLDGLDERFAFVSIDVDFGESIYQGIKYFYPRLNKGGYIFIHDYNSRLTGVRDAVNRYEKEYDVHMCKVPLCDMNGTLIITK